MSNITCSYDASNEYIRCVITQHSKHWLFNFLPPVCSPLFSSFCTWERNKKGPKVRQQSLRLSWLSAATPETASLSKRTSRMRKSALASLKVLTLQWTKICISCLAFCAPGIWLSPVAHLFVALPTILGSDLIKICSTYQRLGGSEAVFHFRYGTL